MSRLCEEFNVPPSVAVREWRRDRHLVSAILDLRAYHRAWQRVETARDGDDLDRSPHVDLVFRHAADKKRERQAARRREGLMP